MRRLKPAATIPGQPARGRDLKGYSGTRKNGGTPGNVKFDKFQTSV